MSMSYKIFSFFSKIGDCFPIGGGAAGAVSQYKEFTYLPTWEAIVAAMILAAAGAAVGYLVKLGFDVIFRNLKRKYRI